MPAPLVHNSVARMYRCHSAQVLGYVPPVAHFGKKVTYVDLYAVYPSTGLLKRKRYKLNRHPSGIQRKQVARDLVEKLNNKLRSGWNPWTVDEAPKAMHTLKEVCEQFLASKNRTLTNRSPIYYRSQMGIFTRWCAEQELLDRPVGIFNRGHAWKYLDHAQESRKLNNTTYNNYLRFVGGLFSWMVEREFRTDNPFNAVRPARQVEKLRVLITASERTQALEWFAVHKPEMVLVCLWVFHTLLRPRSELLRIKVKDVDLKAGVVNVTGTDSKSKDVRRPAIPKVMMPYLLASPLVTAHPDEYVCGKGLGPSWEKSGYNNMGYHWDRMRKALGWGPEKQLYSMRDSGIVQLIADGVDLHVVMRQADHKDISTTNRYVQHYFPNGIREVQERATAFSNNPMIKSPEMSLS